ncbi:MAG: citrate lyase holo-[Bacteroidales bacterium]|nr:citrate lyase holo-[acyl-carrier protein] synthase [Bacteroidales bacterium]
MEEVTLEQLLQSRDNRQQLQRQLLRDYPSHTLVCITIVMPGKAKRTPHTSIIAQAAVEALQQTFTPLIAYLRERDLPTGYEIYACVKCDAREAKHVLCEIESSHPLGRLFDMDVILPDGTPLSRQSIGRPARRCLLCDNEVRYCMRNHTHSPEDLLEHIAHLVSTYGVH